MSALRMVSPDEASRRARTRFSRTAPTWAATVFLHGALREQTDNSQAPSETCEGLPFTVPLHPPTERQVIEDSAAAHAWVEVWRASRFANLVEWGIRRWPSVGTQTVPERLIMRAPQEVACVAGASSEWGTMRSRSCDIALRWRSSWRACHPDADAASLADAVRSTAQQVAKVSPQDWSILLAVIDWLSAHPHETPYARQLPIRGIDTKWIERHRALLKPLCRAINGAEPVFAQPPRCVRTHVLDRGIAPEGIVDLALPICELDRVVRRARLAIVCENLVSTLTLPDIPGAIAVHGGGYAVGDLRCVPSLADIPLLYWGDLDTNGFVILNDMRSAFPHTTSVLMDRETLERHLDLCVEEPQPNAGRLSRLTAEEAATLETLRRGDPARGIASLRLEQERIEWDWACGRILQAASTLESGS